VKNTRQAIGKRHSPEEKNRIALDGQVTELPPFLESLPYFRVQTTVILILRTN
jgi:hypothetical protein